MSRETRTSRDVIAGCHGCDGVASYVTKWSGGNAQGVAARHHDATGHTTWVEVNMTISYGPSTRDLEMGAKQPTVPRRSADR